MVIGSGSRWPVEALVAPCREGWTCHPDIRCPEYGLALLQANQERPGPGQAPCSSSWVTSMYRREDQERGLSARGADAYS